MDSMSSVLMDKERMAWKALQEKRVDDFGKLLADDYRGVSDEGISDKNRELSEVRQINFSNVIISDMNVVWVDKDAAVVSAVVTLDAATPDGKTQTSRARTTSVWTKRGKDWLVIYHTDSQLK